MEKLIKDIVELDKEYRQKVDALRKEKDKVDAYVRDEKTKLEKEYKTRADEVYNDTKSKLDKEMIEKQRNADISYLDSVSKMETAFKSHYEDWVEQVYSACLNEK